MQKTKQRLTAGSIARTLAQWTVNNSGHDPDRAYLGMSQIAKSENDLVRSMLGEKWQPTEEDHHRLILGHIFENDMVTRLWESGLVSDDVYYRDFEDEVVADFDERFRGHIDGYLVDDSLLEIKSTFQDKLDRIQSGGRLPTAVYCQVQMYLCHGKHPKSGRRFREAHVIYIARDTGLIWAKYVRPNTTVQKELNAKAQRVLQLVDVQTEKSHD